MVVTLYLSIHILLVHGVLEPIPDASERQVHLCHMDCGGSSGTRREPTHMQGCNANSTINASGWIQTQDLLTVMRLHAAFSMKAWLGSWKNKTQIYVPAVKEKKRFGWAKIDMNRIYRLASYYFHLTLQIWQVWHCPRCPSTCLTDIYFDIVCTACHRFTAWPHGYPISNILIYLNTPLLHTATMVASKADYVPYFNQAQQVQSSRFSARLCEHL